MSEEKTRKIERLGYAVKELSEALEDLDDWCGEAELKLLIEIEDILDRRAYKRAQVFLREEGAERAINHLMRLRPAS